MSARKRTRSQSRDLSDGGGTEKRLCDDTRQGVHVGTSARRGLPTPPATSAQQELPTPPATSAQQGLPTPPATQRKGVQRRLQSSQMETPTRYSLRSSKTGSTSERTRLEPVLENPTMKTFTFRTPIKLREPIRKLDALEEDVEMDLEEQDMDVEEQETGEKRTRERVESPTRKRTENGRPSSDASTSSTAPAIAYPSPTRESTENALPSSGAATSSTVPAIVPHPIADCSLPSVGVDCHDHPVNQSSPPSRSPSMNVNTVRDAGFSSNPEDPLQFTTMGSTSIQDDIQVASATGSVTSMVSPLSSPGVHPHVAEKEDLADSPSTPSTSFHDSQILSASSSHGDVLSSQMLSASSSHTDVLSHSSSMSVETPLLDGPQPSKPSTSFHGGSQVVSTSSSRVDVVSRSSSLGEDPCMPEKEKPLSELPPDRSTSFSSGSQIMSASSSHADVLSHSSSMSVEPPLLDGPQPSKPSTSLHGGSQVVSTSSSRVDVVSRSSSLGEDLRMPKKEKPLPELSPSRSTSSSRADVLSHSSLMIVEQPLVDKPDLPQTPSPATRPTSFHGDSQVMNTSNRCTDVVSRSSSMGVDPSRSTSFFGGSQIISASSSRADVISHSSLMNVESPLLDGPNLPTHSPAARPTSFHNGSHPRSTSSRMGSVSFHDDSQIISASGTCDDVISHASSMGADSPLRGQTQPLTSSLLMELDALHDDQAVITPDYQLQTDAISYVSSMKIGPLSIEPQAEARSSDRKISSLSSMSAVLGGDNAAPADGSSSIEVTGILGHCRPDSPSAATQPHVPARRRLPSVFSEDSDDGSGRSARSAAQSDIVRNLWLDKDLLHLDRLPITTNTASVVVLSDLEDSDASSSMDIMSDQGSPVTRSSRRQSVISSALSSSMGILSDVEEKYASASTLEESSLVYSNSSSVSMQVLSDARPPSTGSSTANSCSTSSRAMLLDQDDFRTPGGAAILSHYSSDDMSLVSASRGITDGMSVAFDNSPSPSILSELYESDGSTAMDILSFQRSPSSSRSLLSVRSGITDGMSVGFANTPSPSILSELYESDGSTAMDILSFQRSPSSSCSRLSVRSGITDGMSVGFANSPSPSILSGMYESDGSTAMDILSFQRSPSGSHGGEYDNDEMDVDPSTPGHSTRTNSFNQPRSPSLELRGQVISRSVSVASFGSEAHIPSDVRISTPFLQQSADRSPHKKSGSDSNGRPGNRRNKRRSLQDDYRSHLSPPPGLQLDLDVDMDYIPANQLYDSDATIDADKETEDEDEIDDEGNVIILSPASECLILSGQSILEGGQDGNHESGSQHGGASDYIPDISVDDRLARRPAMAKVYKKFKRQPGAPVRHGDMAEFVVALCDDGRGRRTSARTRRARSVDSERVISSQTTVSESSSTNASSRTSTRRRRPSSKKPRNVRRGRDPVRVQIAALVRSHAFDMMDRTRAPVGPDPITSVSLAHVTRYATTKRKEHGPNEDHLELFLDFRSVLPTSRPICNVWNTQAGAVFTANFLRQYPEYQTQRAIVLACFKAHLRQLENQFNRFSAFDDEETREKAVVDRKVQLRRERCSRRIKTLEAFRGKSATVDRLAKLSRNKFDWKVCSGDDTDSDGEKVITTLDWRAEEVRPMFRIVDLLTLVLRFPDGVHATSGQFPQHRYDPVDAREHGEPVLERRRTDPQRGLPENFYNPTWLRSLDEDARERLEMTRPISFEFPRALVGLAETAVPVKDRKSKPLPRNWDI